MEEHPQQQDISDSPASSSSTEIPSIYLTVPAETPPASIPLQSTASSTTPDDRQSSSLSPAASNEFVYNNPPPRQYTLSLFDNMPGSITEAEKREMLQSLRTHRVNTIAELRRIERILAGLGTSDVTAPMTAAWTYYVNSNMLLTDLRSLTRNYPFSSDCLDEAKRRVYADPSSNRSWNLCWLVLSKTQTDRLLPYYAQYQASQPAMWGGRTPTAAQVTQLANAFTAEWEWALGQMLRHWEQPPCR